MVRWALQAINEETFTSIAYNMAARVDDEEDSGAQGERHDVLASLTTLSHWLYTLLNVFRDGCSADVQRACGRGSIFNIDTQSAHDALDVYRVRVLANGWCPYNLPLFTNLNTFSYASTFPAFKRSPIQGSDHQACNPDRCIAWHNINTSEYVTQHAPTCSNPTSCPFLSPSLPCIRAHLSSRRVPIMVYDGKTLSVRCADDGPYIAVSHVWADGLGSTTEAGLPVCQIARIAKYACQLVPAGAFWVDSLCIPNQKDLRKVAIQLMAETYQGADAVVVLDAGIRSLCDSTAPIKEIAFRIETSAWMQRIWTLQEALLARELYFETRSGLYSMAQLNEERRGNLARIPSSLGITMPSEPLLEYYMPNLLLFTIAWDPSQLRTFCLLVHLLNKRTTAKPEDETLAIAGLLGVNVSKLLEEDGADARMKLALPGFRWAPRTLTANIKAISSPTDTAQCTSEGLTSDEELIVILLPQSNDSNPEHKPCCEQCEMDIDNVADKTMYMAHGRGDSARCRYHPRWNGLLVIPRELAVPAESFIELAAVAVHIPPEEWTALIARREGTSGGRAIVCEYLFPARLGRVDSVTREKMLRVFMKGSTPVFPLVQGMFLSARVTLT
ncbi:hypothetical protein C8Q76DRAFT_758316 [Earliella scabrosa]|nr:hypothetical protein C8Q76DRAFT_758316 [Earliella scabrosa]